MKFFALVTVMTGMVAAAPAYEALVARAITTPKTTIKATSTAKAATSTAKAATSTKAASGTPLLSVGLLGGSSSPLVGVGVGGNTLIAIGGSGSNTKPASTVTVKPTSPVTYPTAFPSTFSAPVQGQGKLTLDNLPALPAVIDKTFSGVLGTVYGLMSGTCSADFKCSITIAGTIESLLVDGGKYTAATSIQAWCDNGKCYGSANPTVTATAPFTITCDRLSGTNACSATISGLVRAIFTNGNQVEAWGWVTPAGYCQNGICTASITAFGDPMY